MLSIVQRQILIKDVIIHEINVISPIKKQITLYTNIANQTPKSLPIVRLGRINDKLYLLADFDVFYGVKESKLTQIECEVI